MKAQSNIKPKDIEILGDKVLVRYNIIKVIRVDEIDNKETDMYEYDEIRYKKDEYIQLLKKENNQMWDTLSYIIKNY